MTDDDEPNIIINNRAPFPGIPTWMLGRRFQVDLPGRIRLTFERLFDYEGPPHELHDIGVPLMSPRLAKALLDAGVTTLDLYDAVLHNPDTGEEHPYYAYNVTSLLAVADMGRSDWRCFDRLLLYDVSFFKIVIDEDKCQGELLFRLGQNINGLLVHEQVRESIIRAGIDTISFVAPEDWMQL